MKKVRRKRPETSMLREILAPKQPESVMEEPKVSITIFMESGKTFTFHRASIVVSNEGMLIFNYISAFDGSRKHAEFPRANFVGHSVFPV